MRPWNWFSWMIAFMAIMVVAVEASAQRPVGGPVGGRPNFDRFLQAFDTNKDGMLGLNEVPFPVWLRISQADSNGDNQVSRVEYDSYRP